MMTIENECVGCLKEMGCLYDSCPYYKVKRFYCEECGGEDTLYKTDWGDICSECLLSKFSIIEGSEI